MTLSREFGRSSLLTSSPKTYLYRWTFATCLPADKKSHAYAVLRRVWADHTMNTVKRTDAGPVPGPRGAYVESREDHITTVLFQIWAAMPGVAFASTLLDLWDIPHGTISDIHWSYLWEQKPEPRARPNIADIVFLW